VICACPVPVQSLNRARHGDVCLKCGRMARGDWIADDDTIPAWFDRLAESMNLPLDQDPGHPFEFFRRHAVNRERAGRDRFRLSYLGRDNAVEGMEEAVDGSMYAALEDMRDKRAGRSPSVHLLMAAMYAAKMHECFMRHRAERRGTPTASVDE
jgi:hypothetical protein